MKRMLNIYIANDKTDIEKKSFVQKLVKSLKTCYIPNIVRSVISEILYLKIFCYCKIHS